MLPHSESHMSTVSLQRLALYKKYSTTTIVAHMIVAAEYFLYSDISPDPQ